MRENMGKYRGIRIDNGEWVYGNLYEGVMLSTLGDTCIQSKFGTISLEYEVDPETVGQSTGLHDKNGKEVFEGDVVKSGMTGARYLICWSDEELAWNKRHLDANVSDRPIWQDETYSSVIGNEHQNPELLEGGEK